MTSDTVRMVATYAAALLILIGCFLLLVIQSQVPSEQLLPFVTGIVGVVIGFLFNRESTTSGARASERSMAVGASTTANTISGAASTTPPTQ